MTPRAKLVFFGNEKLATGITAKPMIQDALRAAGYEIEQIVDGEVRLEKHEAQVAVLAAHGRMLAQSLLDQFPLGIINVHPSLLPTYRGPTPIEQAILDGAERTGVSIMQITAQMDAGPILAQQSVELEGLESKAELAAQLQALGAKLVVEVLDDLIAGNAKPEPQTGTATYCKKITKSDGEIDWRKPAEVIEREIRAYRGWPGSRSTLAGSEVIITQANVIDQSGRAGDPFLTEARELAVYCGQGALLIKRLKPVGKREMTGQEFLAGHRL